MRQLMIVMLESFALFGCFALWVGTADADERFKAITFADLKFDMGDKKQFHRSMLSARIEQTIAEPVQITGYMSPSSKQDGVTEFVLLENVKMRFGAISPCEFIVIRLRPEQSASYTVRPIIVEGRLKIEEISIDGKTFAVYQMHNAELIPQRRERSDIFVPQP